MVTLFQRQGINHHLFFPLIPGCAEDCVINCTAQCKRKLRCSSASLLNPIRQREDSVNLPGIARIIQVQMLVSAARRAVRSLCRRAGIWDAKAVGNTQIPRQPAPAPAPPREAVGMSSSSEQVLVPVPAPHRSGLVYTGLLRKLSSGN